MTPQADPASGEGALRIFELDYRKDPRWEEFISSHPGGLIYHHPGWLMALEIEYGQKCRSLACEDERGHLKAILPLFYTKGLSLKFGRIATGRRLSSLPRTPMAGPLAADQKAAEKILAAAMDLVDSQPGVQIEIKTRFGDLRDSAGALACIPWRPTYTAELPPPAEVASWAEFSENLRLARACQSCKSCRALRLGNARRWHRVNWAVNQGIKLGLEVREADTEEDLAIWYRLYLLTMRRIAVPPRPYRFFQSLWRSLQPGGKMRLLLAEQRTMRQKRMVAGSILLQFGQTVFYAFTGCATEDWHLYPNDALQMAAIRNACREGFRWYDFGEVAENNDTLEQFKTKWGGVPKPLFRYYYPEPAPQGAEECGRLAIFARKIWRFLPPKATEVFGDWIYRRL